MIVTNSTTSRLFPAHDIFPTRRPSLLRTLRRPSLETDPRLAGPHARFGLSHAGHSGARAHAAQQRDDDEYHAQVERSLAGEPPTALCLRQRARPSLTCVRPRAPPSPCFPLQQNVIGYDPYAPQAGGGGSAGAGASMPPSGSINADGSAYANMKGLMALAKTTGGVDESGKGQWRGKGKLRGGWLDGTQVPVAADKADQSTTDSDSDSEDDSDASPVGLPAGVAAAPQPGAKRERERDDGERKRSKKERSEKDKRKSKHKHKKEKHKKEKHKKDKHKKDKKEKR